MHGTAEGVLFKAEAKRAAEPRAAVKQKQQKTNRRPEGRRFRFL